LGRAGFADPLRQGGGDFAGDATAMTSFPMLYASIPKIACKGKCQAACGPIAASPREMVYFEEKSGKPFPDDMAMLKTALKTKRVPDCPYLNALGRCEQYLWRPSICRLWGVVDGMRCPFGCVAERVLSDAAAGDILREAE
jgi:hypothetical protein